MIIYRSALIPRKIFFPKEFLVTHQYRPIPVLSCFSKILKRVMHNCLYKYLIENNILYSKQFDFENVPSTDHAVVQLVDQITESFEDNKYTLGVFIDLSKGFDTIDIFLKKNWSCIVSQTEIMDRSRATSRIEDNSIKSMKTKTLNCSTRLNFRITPISFICERLKKCFKYIGSKCLHMALTYLL